MKTSFNLGQFTITSTSAAAGSQSDEKRMELTDVSVEIEYSPEELIAIYKEMGPVLRDMIAALIKRQVAKE